MTTTEPRHHTPAFPAAAEPPSPTRVALGAPSHLHNTTSGLRMMRTHSQAQARVKSTPGVPDYRTPASLSPRAAAGEESRRASPPPAPPNHPGRQIWNQRPRLDPSPSNLSHPIWIQAPRSKRTGSPCQFCLRAPTFLPYQPALLCSSKIFTDRPYFYRFNPRAFWNLCPQSSP